MNNSISWKVIATCLIEKHNKYGYHTYGIECIDYAGQSFPLSDYAFDQLGLNFFDQETYNRLKVEKDALPNRYL